MEGNSHDPVSGVKRFFYTISVVDVNVNIQHPSRRQPRLIYRQTDLYLHVGMIVSVGNSKKGRAIDEQSLILFGLKWLQKANMHAMILCPHVLH